MYPDTMDEHPKGGRPRRTRTHSRGTGAVREESPWKVDVNGANNRRFLIGTEYDYRAGRRFGDLLRTETIQRVIRLKGTLGNCSGGLTPWGTLVSGEENFNSYFKAQRNSRTDNRRYGLTTPAGPQPRVGRP